MLAKYKTFIYLLVKNITGFILLKTDRTPMVLLTPDLDVCVTESERETEKERKTRWTESMDKGSRSRWGCLKSRWGGLTVEQQAPSGHAPASPVLGHTLVHASVLRPEVRDLQDAAAGVVDLHLARERLTVSSSPPDGRHGAAGDGGSHCHSSN